MKRHLLQKKASIPRSRKPSHMLIPPRIQAHPYPESQIARQVQRDLTPSKVTESVLALISISYVSGRIAKKERENVRDVQKAIVILVLLVDAAHKSSSRGNYFSCKDEQSLLGGELYTLANNVDELSHGEVRRHKILLLVDGGDVSLLALFTDYLHIDLELATEKAVRTCQDD